MTDYATLSDDEVDRLAQNGDENAELESRHRHLRVTKIELTICLRCGQEIDSEHFYERRDTGEPWRDPFAAEGRAMFTENHPFFCPSGRRFGRRLNPRTSTITVRIPT